MRQQENKKENFRENPPKLTWIPKVYNYAERTGNLKAEAVGVVSGEKHFPVFEDRMVFKPLTKSKPFSTPLFACAEVFWSWVIDTYFVPAPLYQLAFCRGYEAECEKYYDYGTVSPMIYEEGEHLLNLLEFFRTYPDEKVQIDDYLNYCQMFYDYTEILEADYFQTHRGIAEDLAMQILISVLKGDQNYHYENIAFVCDASGQILRLAPMIDHEFSTCFMFPDNELEINCIRETNNKYVNKALRDIGKMLEKKFTQVQLWAVSRAKHITVFSDFPVGLAIIGNSDTSLQGYKEISYRPISPLTRCLQNEMEKHRQIHYGIQCKIAFAECVLNDEENRAIRACSNILVSSLKKLSKENQKLQISYGETLTVSDLKKILYLILDYPHKHYTFKHFEV